MLYFDHNATSPLCPAAREAWLDASARYVGNPSSPHRAGARADTALNAAREKLAGWLGCSPLDIVWTSGATEAVNTVVNHFSGAGSAVVSAIEHPCLLAALKRGFAGPTETLPVDGPGVVRLEDLPAALERLRPALVAVMAANNETGVLQPWESANALCRQAGIPFFCDAAQWIGKMPLRGLGDCTYVSGCAHKFGGPQGVGFLKCTGRLRPLIVGGPQEDGRRAGTENVAGVLAMVAALEDRQGVILARGVALREMRLAFEEQLLRSVPEIEVVGRDADRLWNTVSVVMPPLDCRQRWVVKLDKLGFAVSTGSACASGKEQPSHVLTAMGFSPEKAGRVLRLSCGWDTTAADWEALLGALVAATRP